MRPPQKNSTNFKPFLAIRLCQAHQTLLGTHGDQLPSLSGGHGSKDFLCSAHLVEAFVGRIYSLKHFHKCKFVHQRPQQDEHYRENPWNHDLLRVRGVECRVLLKMFGGIITLYWLIL